MSAVRVISGPGTVRVYVCGLRVHHGRVGILAMALGLLALRPALVAVGVLAAVHDRADYPWPWLDG